MRHVTIAALAVLLLASPAQGQLFDGLSTAERARQLPQESQILYCVDEGAAGFHWDKKGKARSTQFTPERFTVKVVSETELMIAWSVGLTQKVTCTRGVHLICGPPHIIFGPNGYTRADLFGRPLWSGLDEILVAYGTCTKF